MSWKISNLLWAALVVFMMSCGTTPNKESHSSYSSTECLIEVDELVMRNSYSDGCKIIDLRKPSEFEKGHIPEALNVWRNQITDTSYSYGGMMPSKQQTEALLSRLGINATDTIIIYDNKAECDAARLWWILKFYGHQNIKLLNGGLKAWGSADGQLTITETNPVPSEYRFLALPDTTIHASMSLVQSIISEEGAVLLDTRSTEEFNGKIKDGAAKGGHIKNAINLDWAMAVDYNGSQKFLTSDQLKANFEAIGITGEKPVVTYCHSGVRSAHTLFVLTELLGYRNIKNYDGSWIERSHHSP